jgi:hypothetical protein
VSNVGRRQINHIEVAVARKGTTQNRSAAAVRDPACETVKVAGVTSPTIKSRNRHKADSGRGDKQNVRQGDFDPGSYAELNGAHADCLGGTATKTLHTDGRDGVKGLEIGAFGQNVTVRTGVKDKGGGWEARYGGPTGGEGNGLSRQLRRIRWGRMFRPIDGDDGGFVLTEESRKFEFIVLQHCPGDIVITHFHQVHCRLYVTGWVRDIGRKNPSSAIYGHRLSYVCLSD